MVLDIIGRVAVRMVVSKFDRLARVAIDSLIAAARTYDCETARAHAVRLIGQVATHAHFMNSRVEEYCASFLVHQGRAYATVHDRSRTDAQDACRILPSSRRMRSRSPPIWPQLTWLGSKPSQS